MKNKGVVHGSDGPAIKCTGHDEITNCEDYPNGACDNCCIVQDRKDQKSKEERSFAFQADLTGEEME